MTFFNKKEDVLKIELTPYGRHLLSKGELKPDHYAFYDDDVLYDSAAAGFSEDNSQIKTRILQETISVKPQRCLESPENLISVNERSEEETYPHVNLNLNYLTEPLGTSETSNDYAPGWKSTFLKGEISGSISTTFSGSRRDGNLAAQVKRSKTNAPDSEMVSGDIGSSQYLKQIPQIESTIEYKMQVRNISNSSTIQEPTQTPAILQSTVYPDGSYIKILNQQILCQLLETNGFHFKDGLEVEVYIYEDEETEVLRPLKFLPTTTTIKNDLLVEADEVADISPDNSYVEYYINFNTDTDIPSRDICEGLQYLKTQDVLVDIDIECEDLDETFFDIYGTRIESLEECE